VVSEEKFLLSPKGSKRDIHVKKERKGILWGSESGKAQEHRRQMWLQAILSQDLENNPYRLPHWGLPHLFLK
jgi:hypothetical protein